MRAVLPLLVAAGLGCGAADRERSGDETYARGRYAEALEIYGALPGADAEPRVLAKLGAAALRSGRLGEATDAYLHLAGEDPDRGTEAAAGLEAVARAAEQSGDGAALRQAAQGLQTIAPDAGAGRYALVLAQEPNAAPAELVSLLPAAIAAAGDQAQVDSLLFRYGNALEATTGCGQALLQYRAVLRRTQVATLRSAAQARTGQCALAQGHRAQAAGRAQDAALWFTEASRVDSASVTGRRALVSLGDLHLRQGDTLAAAIAFQTAAGAPGESGDSVATVARVRLSQLGLTP